MIVAHKKPISRQEKIMKKSLAIVLAIGLLLPCCVRKKTSQTPTKKDAAHAYDAHAGKSGTYDEAVGAFVLDDDADYDVFDLV